MWKSLVQIQILPSRISIKCRVSIIRDAVKKDRHVATRAPILGEFTSMRNRVPQKEEGVCGGQNSLKPLQSHFSQTKLVYPQCTAVRLKAMRDGGQQREEAIIQPAVQPCSPTSQVSTAAVRL